ncbi:SAF domain-containing protein [Nocardiopsis sp. FR26]|uniref:SAF domain-containing protein n=1 Tax=Nocardiopsis sp. FR26 TaxID=2605987 RepID=UPI001F2BF9C9|nr:SAF domain-containing protein [Nocardiopsis sp. FR26]
MDTKTAPPPAAPPTVQGAPQVRLTGGGRRRWRWLVLALGLTTAGALSGVLALEQLDERSGVLVADTDLPAGHVVTAEDLRIVEVAVTEGVSAVSADRLEEAVGSTLTIPVARGSLLPETVLGAEAAFPEQDRALVGATLGPGRFPASLRPGAAVSVVVTGDEAGGVRAYRALVQSLDTATADDGSATLELVVDSADAADIASAAAGEQVSVVQVNPRGGV